MGQYHRHLPLTARAPAGHRLIDSREGNFQSSGFRLNICEHSQDKIHHGVVKEAAKEKPTGITALTLD